MARRVTPAQLRSMVWQVQTKQKQAIEKYNREVRAHDQNVKTAINKYSQEATATTPRFEDTMRESEPTRTAYGAN